MEPTNRKFFARRMWYCFGYLLLEFAMQNSDAREQLELWDLHEKWERRGVVHCHSSSSCFIFASSCWNVSWSWICLCSCCFCISVFSSSKWSFSSSYARKKLWCECKSVKMQKYVKQVSLLMLVMRRRALSYVFPLIIAAHGRFSL